MCSPCHIFYGTVGIFVCKYVCTTLSDKMHEKTSDSVRNDVGIPLPYESTTDAFKLLCVRFNFIDT